MQQLSNAQQQNAQRLSAGDDTAQAMLNPTGPDPGDPAGACTPGPRDDIKNFAAKCEVHKWKQAMAAMRAQTVNESPIGQIAANDVPPGGAPGSGVPFTERSQAEQQRLIRENPQAFGSPPNPAPSVGANAGEHVAPTPPAGVATPPDVAERTGGAATEHPCRDYQGGYLAWQMANNPAGSNGTAPGTMPPLAGRAPRGARPGTLSSGPTTGPTTGGMS